jgi:hypothetical protein
MRATDCRFFQSKNYEVFFTEAHKIPNILHEIGRLREITFREVGEGTNESIDLDKYDQYYHHMFLWDEETKRVAGAYRMGLGSEIFPKYGMEGFYLNDLFRFDSELHDMMKITNKNLCLCSYCGAELYIQHCVIRNINSYLVV